MGRWQLTTAFGLGPAWVVTGPTYMTTGLLADAHVGTEYVTAWPTPTFALGCKIDAGFSAFAGTNGDATTARFSETVRGGIRIAVMEKISVETMIGVGPTQDVWHQGDGSWDLHVATVLAFDIPLTTRWQISPSVGYVWASAFDGPAYAHHGVLFGVRLGGRPTEDHAPSTPMSKRTLPPVRPLRDADTATGIGQREIEPGPLGDPRQYPQTFLRLRERLDQQRRDQQGAPSDFELQRYVTLFLLAGLFTFDTAYLTHVVLDPHIITAWRQRPAVILAGLHAYFALAKVAADPAAHPEAEEHNALLLWHDLLQLSTPQNRAPREITAAEFARIVAPYRLGRSWYPGVDMGCNMYLLFVTEGRAGRLPSEPVLRQLAAMGGFTSFIARVRAMKRRGR